MRLRLGDRGTPRLTAGQVTTILKRHGFALVGQSGSHQKWRNPATSKQVIVAQHKGRVLPIGTMRSIIAGSGLSFEEWHK
jgi:predicted RNA binding protein YcfA (HicA-like mRNA interferase family)